MIRHRLKHLGQSLFSGLGFVWLFFEALYGLTEVNQSRIGFITYISIGVVVGVIWFIIDGLCFSGFLRKSIEITSNAIDVQITIMFGDLFDQDGFKAVSVNEFFDSAVNEKHVASSSLHGLMLKKYWAGNTKDWDDQVAKDLSSIQPEDSLDRPSPGKPKRYALGTTALVSSEKHDFLCVALAKTCLESLEASATSDELQYAVRGLLCKARSVCAGQPLNIPLLGSGLARTGIKPNIIIHLLLLAIFEESKIRKITNHIKIVLPKRMWNRIDLITIQRDWR